MITILISEGRVNSSFAEFMIVDIFHAYSLSGI
jgi:hypothetical protein